MFQCFFYPLDSCVLRKTQEVYILLFLFSRAAFEGGETPGSLCCELLEKAAEHKCKIWLYISEEAYISEPTFTP